MTEAGPKKKPYRPGAQFVVRVEPEFAERVKERAKELGYKTEPYIRRVLEHEDEHPSIQPNRDSVQWQIEHARALGYVQGLLADVYFPDPDPNDPKNAGRVL